MIAGGVGSLTVPPINIGLSMGDAMEGLTRRLQSELESVQRMITSGIGSLTVPPIQINGRISSSSGPVPQRSPTLLSKAGPETVNHITNNYLTIHSQARQENLVSDFALMRAWAGV